MTAKAHSQFRYWGSEQGAMSTFCFGWTKFVPKELALIPPLLYYLQAAACLDFLRCDDSHRL